MRAIEPTATGRATNPDDGVTVAWESFGADGPAVVLPPTWMIVHSRHWKMQVPFLARKHRVVTFDPRGNGASDRPLDPAAHGVERLAGDVVAVMDACEIDRAALIGNSAGANTAMTVAAVHPERVDALVLIAPALHSLGRHPDRRTYDFESVFDDPEGWQLFTRKAWQERFDEFVGFFLGECYSEPHSTKAWDDAVGWALETDGESLAASTEGWWDDWCMDTDRTLAMCARITCPTLFLHGTADRITWVEVSRRAAAAVPGAVLLEMEGTGHMPQGREPVATNLAIERFLDDIHGRPRPQHAWVRGLERRRRVLYVSSPIGLGHVRRDVAIAGELARLRPDLEIDWLAQHPVTAVLEHEGQRVHPASRWLASESAHITEQACGHDLHAFEAIRAMDEILLANFHTFQAVVDEGAYDLVVADEAWDIDHFWFENPELKRAPLVWMTDFVGFLPMPSGGDREAFVAADYNAEMIEHVARYPAMRDQAIFVGDPDDVVPAPFGEGLPQIRAWTEANFRFSGYITGFDADRLGDRDERRAEVGFGPDEHVCVVAVGGSGVGRALLDRAVASFDLAKELDPALRMIVVCGPRIDPASFAPREGLDVVGFVPRLYRQLAACDVAFVQGGLTTTMELVASRTPFLYAPLANHFEQQFHVRHRLDRHGAGRCIDAATATPAEIAGALVAEMARAVDYRPVAVDGAARAAAAIAPLLG
jgi:pimeloyl-ACP methyl ester carboxylesterase/predicted glycosyltransferase